MNEAVFGDNGGLVIDPFYRDEFMRRMREEERIDPRVVAVVKRFLYGIESDMSFSDLYGDIKNQYEENIVTKALEISFPCNLRSRYFMRYYRLREKKTTIAYDPDLEIIITALLSDLREGIADQDVFDLLRFLPLSEDGKREIRESLERNRSAKAGKGLCLFFNLSGSTHYTPFSCF